LARGRQVQAGRAWTCSIRPRGGVAVAATIAARLAAPPDLLPVRKIGAPMQPGFAMGAICNGPEPILVTNPEVVAQAGVTEREFAEPARQELAELARRRALYCTGRPPLEVAGRTAIVLAVPVAPPGALAELSGEADRIVCLRQSHLPFGIGGHYEELHQLADDEVIRLLPAAHTAGGDAGA
jgi:predicted phosphoribosyltransferase